MPHNAALSSTTNIPIVVLWLQKHINQTTKNISYPCLMILFMIIYYKTSTDCSCIQILPGIPFLQTAQGPGDLKSQKDNDNNNNNGPIHMIEQLRTHLCLRIKTLRLISPYFSDSRSIEFQGSSQSGARHKVGQPFSRVPTRTCQPAGSFLNDPKWNRPYPRLIRDSACRKSALSTARPPWAGYVPAGRIFEPCRSPAFSTDLS